MFGTHPRLEHLAYRAQNFRDIADSAFGEALWLFMRRADNVVRMEAATYLGRAAVEPLTPGLRAAFGAELAANRDRLKQMIGHMARQVMEEVGYEVDRRGLRITRPNALFTTAARYRRVASAEGE